MNVYFHPRDIRCTLYYYERSELSNPGSILMMCVLYVRTYVSITLRNVTVTSRRNVASMMRIRTPGITIFPLSRVKKMKCYCNSC